jgi:protein involved in polysaccharide export with SLBB domain
MVFIGGAVEKPGMYDIREVDPKRGYINALEALALAGGAKETAALSRAVIYRAGSPPSQLSSSSSGPLLRQETVNIAAIGKSLANGAPPATAVASPTSKDASEILLYPGDTIQIPESTAQFVMMGMVKNPGSYPLPEDRGVTLAQAIGIAGGPNPRAQLNEVGIIRISENDATVKSGQPAVVKANLNAFIKKQDARQNPYLKPGDVVYVPETSRPDWGGKILPSFASLAQILYFGTYVGKH